VGSPERRDGGVGTRVAGERLGGPLWSSSVPDEQVPQDRQDDHKGLVKIPRIFLAPPPSHRPRPYGTGSLLKRSGEPPVKAEQSYDNSPPINARTTRVSSTGES
jgi:hypothetical protein